MPKKLCLFIVLFADIALRAQTYQFKDYPINANAAPVYIANGPDGAFWVAESTNKIARMTTDGVLTNEFTVPTSGPSRLLPESIITGPDGSLWFAIDYFDSNSQPFGASIARMNTAGKVSAVSLLTAGINGESAGVTAGPDGAIWFTEDNQTNGWIGRMTLDGTITAEYPLPTAGYLPRSITVGSDGALWFIETIVNFNLYPTPASKIGRITTSGVLTEFATPEYVAPSSAIIAGSDKALWFTSYSVVQGNIYQSIDRITTSGTITRNPVFTPGLIIQSMVTGPDGAIWFTESDGYGGNSRIGRYGLDGSFAETALPTATSIPRQIVVGPDGAFWYAESGIGDVGRAQVISPTVTSISPNSATACGPAFTLTLNGTFQSGATVQFGNVYSKVPLTLSSSTATSLTASVPASLISYPGAQAIYVANPNGTTPAAGPPILFPINFTPQISSLATSIIPTGAPATFQITIANYIDGVTHVRFGSGSNYLPVVSTAAAQGSLTAVTLQIPASLMPSTPQTVSLSVVNVDASNPTGAAYPASCSPTVNLNFVGGLPTINPAPNGVFSTVGYGAFTTISPGDWIDIYGTDLAQDTRQWTADDFNGIHAPTSLDGTRVTVGGQLAFIYYIAQQGSGVPSQVNALVPFTVPTGLQPVVVTTNKGSSAPYMINVAPASPGLLAPPAFNIGGKQYAVAVFADGVTYALPTGAIPGVASRPAKPGDSLILYGVGFGPVSPSLPAGDLVQVSNQIVAPLQISIGGAQANVGYAGLAPSFTGLYQFNITVPNVGDGAAVPLTFQLSGTAGAQTLYLPVSH